MNRITPIARILLGLTFFVFSLNFFVPFLPKPGVPSPEVMQFVGALMATGLMTLVKVVELAAGVALLTNRAVPLALALLAPIIVGITAFHLALAPAGIAVPLAVLALELVLAWSYRSAFAPMLRLRVTPAVTPAARGTRLQSVAQAS